jgi:hypothetical protein
MRITTLIVAIFAIAIIGVATFSGLYYTRSSATTYTITNNVTTEKIVTSTITQNNSPNSSEIVVIVAEELAVQVSPPCFSESGILTNYTTIVAAGTVTPLTTITYLLTNSSQTTYSVLTLSGISSGETRS